jgi:S1-C subfamily serine protease
MAASICMRPAMSASSSSDLPDAVERVARSVVAVVASRRSVGSATVWRDRFIVAAAHRVWRAERAQVVLPDGETASATVKGVDPATDLALLALDDTAPAPPVPARADEAAGARAGEFVFAVARDGSGLTQASFGHVGAAAGAWRTWRGGRVDRLIRLDGGLYPGYSGAPVATAQGQTLGIATSGLTRVHGIVLPWSTVDRVLEQLQSHGRVAQGYLGIVAQAVRLGDTQAAALGVAAGGALLLTAVADDGPAAAAGLLLGDVLVAIDGARIETTDDLRDALGRHAVGDELKLLVARGGERKEFVARVGERAAGRCG